MRRGHVLATVCAAAALSIPMAASWPPPAAAQGAGPPATESAQNSPEEHAVPPEEARKFIGKTVLSPSGKKLGKIVDVVGESGGPDRFVIATGKKKLPVSPSKVHYDQERDVAVADMTKKEAEDALPLGGGVELDGDAVPGE